MAKPTETSTIVDKPALGRPTKYKPEYCQLLIDHMSKGYSYQCFGSVVGVAKSTVEDWEKKKAAFRGAKEVGTALSLHFWEKIGINAVCGRIPGFNASAYIFTMKNKFNWTDRTDLKIDATITGFEKEFSQLRDVPRKELIKLVKKPKAS